MTEFSSYAHGTPCWVDVTSPDLEKTIEFYGGLFGWEAEQDPRPEAGGYTMFTLRGKYVAAASPPQEEGIPAHWTTYIASDDVDDTAAKIRDAGGTRAGGAVRRLRFRPDDGRAGSDGRDLRCLAGGHAPRRAARERAGVVPVERVRDPRCRGRRDFYTAVFGYRVDEMDMGQEEPYRLFMLGDNRVAGLFKMTDEMEGVPPNWMTVFAVADCDAAAAKAKELGGELLFGPQDIPVGRFAVLQDSTGAVFQVVAPPSA